MLQRTILHDGWEFAEEGWPGGKVATVRTGWLPAEVPGHVHLDLVRNGVIADPLQRMHELGCQWVDEKDWSYRTSFEWHPKEGCPKRVLRFEGLDTVCSIFLNDELVAEHDNMFVPLEIDVTDLLRDGPNSLRVDFRSAAEVARERRQAYFSKHHLPEDCECFEDRAFVRKAQYMFGWDWGPRLVSCGICRPVCLIEYAARIVDVHVRTEPQPDGKLKIDVRSTLDGDALIEHHIWMQSEPDEHAIREGRCINYFEMDAWCFHRITPWSPDRPVQGYVVSTMFEGYDEERVVHHQVRTPMRTCIARLLREPDDWGESFEFEVNGERLWARGANWIPDHSFPSAVDGARLRDRLLKAKDMGFNMLRVWGGGLYESDEFYDLCDELGILVWQDFPFACSYYPDDEEWQEAIRREAEVNIKRLRNHPCLALWCGNNENHELHFNRWGDAARHPPRYHGEHLYDRELPHLVAELDPARSYIPSSPIGTPPEGTAADAKRRGPNADRYGDQHNWDVWHGRGDWIHYTDSEGRFSSEYGFASSCSTALWRQTLAGSDWDPHSDAVKWHDRTGKGHETFHGYVQLHYPEPTSLEDWVFFSQLNQRDALRHGIEHYRRSEFCRGSLVWQFNDCWPVQSWSILDASGAYKAAAYEMRRLYGDRLLSLEVTGSLVRIWVVWHPPSPSSEPLWDGEVLLQATEASSGRILRSWRATFQAEANSSHVVLEADCADLSHPDTVLFASCGDLTAWRLLDEPKHLRLAPPEPLVLSAEKAGVLQARVKTTVLDLMLTSLGDPSPFVDNFLTFLPGQLEVRLSEMPAEIEARSLAGTHLVVWDDGSRESPGQR
jgi:beta-mannosidase